jgi:hypothetical protein
VNAGFARQGRARIRFAQRRTRRAMACPVGDAVGAIVPPLLVAGLAVMVMSRLAWDCGGELHAVRTFPSPPRDGEHHSGEEGEGQKRRGVRYADGADPERDENP